MRITPVSFGKTVKVNAPHHEAVRLANAANNKDNIQIVKPEVEKQLKDIFDDRDKGHALAVSLKGEEDVSYILSGKESREYQKDLYDTTKFILNAKRTLPLEKHFRMVVDAKQNFAQRTHDLIERTKENFALKVSPNGEKVKVVK